MARWRDAGKIHQITLSPYLKPRYEGVKMKGCQNLLVLDDQDRMAEFMIKKWEGVVKDAIKERGLFVAGLSGGQTPVNFYRTLADHKGTLPWNKIHIFLVDERFLAFDDKDSNYRMLRDTLLDKVQIPQQNLHPIPTGRLTPQLSAEAYEEDLRIFFRSRSGQFPEFDLILLGIGEDGHTASLFPGSPALNEGTRLAVAVMLDEIRHDRITLTMPVINHAKHVVFLVSGKSKAAVLEKVVNEKDPSLPASLVNPHKGEPLFLLDLEAGSRLIKGKRVIVNDQDQKGE
jgi:6-phosphogluconolactonase